MEDGRPGRLDGWDVRPPTHGPIEGPSAGM